jgi:hypothetical protein
MESDDDLKKKGKSQSTESLEDRIRRLEEEVEQLKKKLTYHHHDRTYGDYT